MQTVPSLVIHKKDFSEMYEHVHKQTNDHDHIPKTTKLRVSRL